MRRRTTLLVLLASLAVLGCGRDGPRVRLATTTSARDSGLLDFVLPEVERRTGIRVSVIAVGTGQALELARRGDADLVVVHDRAREDAFVAEGHGIERRDLMWNDFVIVGPPSDPAGVRGSTDVAGSLRAIASASAAFVSRGDDSGTHGRERSLWKRAGIQPSWDAYVETGQGMGPTLLVASERGAYALADRGTYLTMRKRLSLSIVVEGDPPLRNPYGIILVNPERHPAADVSSARAVAEFLTSKEGRAKIDAFRVDGERVFHSGAPGP